MCFFQRFLMVGVHAEEASDTAVLIHRAVEDRVAHVQRSRVNTHKGDLTHVLICGNLEHQPREWLFVVRVTLIVRIVGRGHDANIQR